MKNVFLFLMLSCLAAFTVQAGIADLFEVDEQHIEASFNDLNELETLVTASGSTYADLSQTNNPVLKNLNLNTNLTANAFGAGEPALGIPSFVWGFCLSLPGVVVVYFLTDQDMDETKKALIGFAVGVGLYVLWFVFWRLLTAV
mgnify:CR=1 FL=1